jgi:hypothetical protein
MPSRRNVEVKILTTKFYISFLRTNVEERVNPSGPEVNEKSSDISACFVKSVDVEPITVVFIKD